MDTRNRERNKERRNAAKIQKASRFSRCSSSREIEEEGRTVERTGKRDVERIEDQRPSDTSEEEKQGKTRKEVVIKSKKAKKQRRKIQTPKKNSKGHKSK